MTLPVIVHDRAEVELNEANIRQRRLRLADGAPAPSGPSWWMAIAEVSGHNTGQDPRNEGRRDVWRRMPGWSAAQPAAMRRLVRRIRA